MTSVLPRSIAPVISIGALLLPGCMAVDNDRHVIGRSVPIETVRPAGQDIPVVLPADGPSIVGTDRGNWQRTEYLVPIDGTYHYPQYTFRAYSPTEIDRQRGLAPTPLGALQLDGTNVQQGGESVADPFLAAAEIILMIPRMFIEPPWVAVRSPGQLPYQRSRSEYDPPDAVVEASP